jgi:3'-5' exonuclease
MIYPIKNLKNTLFIDIETVPQRRYYADLPDIFKKLWSKKAYSLDKGLDLSDEGAVSMSYANKAGIFAEFAKIICISVAYITPNDTLRIKSLAGDEEVDILRDFASLLISHYPDTNGYYLCGHNIKEFDIPFLCRRMVSHGVEMPNMLDIAGKKPWQTEHLIDTMDLWRFGDIKNYTSLELLASTLGVATPKDDIDGSMVAHTYYEENDLARIVTYCQKDVVTVANVMNKFTDQPLLTEDQIEIIPWLASEV